MEFSANKCQTIKNVKGKLQGKLEMHNEQNSAAMKAKKSYTYLEIKGTQLIE